MGELTPEQKRVADAAMEAVMEQIVADGWEVPPELQEAVFDAFFMGVGHWRDLVITVRWNDDGPVQ